MTSQTLLGGIVGAVGHFQKKKADEKAEKKAADALQSERDWQERLKAMATSEDQFNTFLDNMMKEMPFDGDPHKRLAFEQEARNRFQKNKQDGWNFVKETVERLGLEEKLEINEATLAEDPDATDVPVNLVDPLMDQLGSLGDVEPDLSPVPGTPRTPRTPQPVSKAPRGREEYKRNTFGGGSFVP